MVAAVVLPPQLDGVGDRSGGGWRSVAESAAMLEVSGLAVGTAELHVDGGSEGGLDDAAVG